eukprot:437709-Lingulodinium_polyedra.AAC.1
MLPKAEHVAGSVAAVDLADDLGKLSNVIFGDKVGDDPVPMRQAYKCVRVVRAPADVRFRLGMLSFDSSLCSRREP